MTLSSFSPLTFHHIKIKIGRTYDEFGPSVSFKTKSTRVATNDLLFEREREREIRVLLIIACLLDSLEVFATPETRYLHMYCMNLATCKIDDER